jgi:CBS domain containing-hemolysin-like protein
VGWLVLLSVVLVLVNGFFVATEMSLVKIRPSRLEQLAEEGRPGAATLLKMVRRLDAYLSATQMGVTLTSLGLGWIGEPTFAALIEQGLSHWIKEGELALKLAHTISIVFGFAAITVLHIVLGELTPKNVAIQKAEETAFTVVWPMRMFYVLFLPGIWLLHRLAAWTIRLFGLKSAGARLEGHSEEELRFILASSVAAGEITSSRAELLERALEMVEKTARQVMVPRNQVRFLDLDEPLEKNVADARLGGHTWLPVCRGDLDHLEGVVNVKDLFYLLARKELKSLSQVQRPVLFVPESVSLEQLLTEFRRRRRQMAVVVDEHGGTSGIVTLADVVAEVVGEVAEFGRRMEEVKTLPGGRLELPGTAALDDLEDRLEVEFDVEEGEITTIGGFLMAKLGRIPAPGDHATVGEYEVRAIETDGPRVVKVRIEPKVKPPAKVEAPKPDGGSAPAAS